MNRNAMRAKLAREIQESKPRGERSARGLSAVNAGKRAGKRRRSNSVTRKQPVTVTKVANMQPARVAEIRAAYPDAIAHVSEHGTRIAVKAIYYREG